MKNLFGRSVQLQVFLLACLPFLVAHHVRPIPTFYPELIAILIGTGLIVSAAWRYGLSVGIALLSPLIWIALITLQILLGPAPPLHDVLGFSGFVLWAILLAAALRQFMIRMPNGGLSNIFALGLLTGASLNALAAILQISVDGVAGVFYSFDKSVIGNIGQRNLLYSYLMLGVISAIHLHSAGRLARPGLAGLLILLTFALNLTGSRAVLIYTACLVVSIWLVPGLAKDRRHVFGITFATAGIVLFQILHPWLVSIFPGFGESMAERFQTLGAMDQVRLNLLAVAGQMVADHPLLGAGLGTFNQRVFWQPLESVDLLQNLTNTAHAHNIAAQLAGELGLLALIPLLVLLLALYRRRPADGAANWWGWLVPTILIIHSLLEYPLWYAHFLGIFAFSMAFAIPAERKILFPSSSLKIGIAISTAAFLFCIFTVVNDYRRLENYPEARISPIQLVQTFNEIATNPLIGQYARSFLAANLNPAPVRIPEKLALCRQSIEDFADEAVIIACLPIYDLAGHVKEASTLRERVARNGPQHPTQSK